LPFIAAITAPSAASYYRLRPNRWAPTWANLGLQDRGASLRVCPVFGEPAAERFNLEYRVADAAASPYMALGAIVWAGLDGIRQKRGLPAPPARNFWDMSEAEREAAGVKPLPRSLSDALDHLEASPAARGWFGDTFFSAYLQFKRAELRALKGLVPAQICERYAAVY
jgi:glutamine synthetase